MLRKGRILIWKGRGWRKPREREWGIIMRFGSLFVPSPSLSLSLFFFLQMNPFVFSRTTNSSQLNIHARRSREIFEQGRWRLLGRILFSILRKHSVATHLCILRLYTIIYILLCIYDSRLRESIVWIYGKFYGERAKTLNLIENY